MTSCGLNNLYAKVNILCNRLSVLEKNASASSSGFSSSDYAFALHNENITDPFPPSLFTFNPTTLDSQNITLQADNATFQVSKAGIYQVILAGSVRTNERADLAETFVYQLTTTPATTTALHILHVQGDPDALTSSMRINELVELPAGGTVAVNILLNMNSTTLPFSLTVFPVTISIIRIA